MSTSGWAAMASPTTGPKPVTRLNTPAGSPTSSKMSASDEGVERGHLTRLDHDGAAGGQGRGHLGGDLVQRVVPRRDAADHADGLPDDERVAHLLLPGEVGGHLGGGGERVERAARPGRAGTGPGHAHFVGDEVGQRVRPRRPVPRPPWSGRRSAPRRAGPTTPGRRPAAAATARSTSSVVPSGTVPMTSSVVESMTSMVPVPVDGHPGPADVERVADGRRWSWCSLGGRGCSGRAHCRWPVRAGATARPGPVGRSAAGRRPGCITLPIYVGSAATGGRTGRSGWPGPRRSARRRPGRGCWPRPPSSSPTRGSTPCRWTPWPRRPAGPRVRSTPTSAPSRASSWPSSTRGRTRS